MIRTQVQLTDVQARRLKSLARQRKVSMAALVREAVDRLTGDDDYGERRRAAIASFGRFSSGQPNIARDHDRYLDEAYRER
jgi:predicted DNA-binding ribbon-helix-helix protein